MLADLALSEDQALALLRVKPVAGAGGQIARWIERWRWKRYVPEAAIAAAGLPMIEEEEEGRGL